MDEAERWRRIEPLLEQAWALPPERLPEFLERVGGESPELREALERLLAADRHPRPFLEAPAGERLAEALAGDEPERIGSHDRFGAFRVQREIGRGGMGTVYLAERTDGAFDQRVAIKMLDAARSSPDARERFRHERRILARLEHPNIARLLDGGVAADGVPWFAMEYVEGQPLTEFCEERTLSVPARLDLFEQVCDAVRHAHRNLVVHRDLKPSNILVTDSGDVKLLDFGIAKLFEDDDTDPGLTRTGVRPMTPAYAAPEQIRGEPVTTATDVWALGALLHELLSGRRPFEGRTAGALERAILEEEPARPATAGVPADGDLRTIVATALRKAPADRYAGVDALLEDVRRYRRGLMILARPATFRYRASKFLRRYRWQSAAAALILVAVVGGLLGTAWQARQARAQAARSERMLSFLTDLFQLSDPARARGEELTARDILDRGGREADSTFADDPESRAELLLILGDLQLNLGFLDRADTLLTLALLRTQEAHGPRSAEAGRAGNVLASALTERGDHARARAVVEQALRVNESALGRRAAETAASLNNLAVLDAREGHPERAIERYREALDIDLGLYGPDHPEVATDLSNLATVLEDVDRLAEADSLLRTALDIRRRALGAEHPDVAVALGNLAHVREALGDWDGAEALYREEVAMDRRVYPEGHPDLAHALTNLAQMLQNLGRGEEAYGLLAEAAELNGRLLGEHNPQVARTLSTLAANAYFRSDYETALADFSRALEAWRAAAGEDAPGTVATRHNRGVVLHLLGRLPEARADLEAAWRLRRERLGDGNWDTAWAQRSLARLTLEEGDAAEAERLFAGAEKVFREQRGNDHHSVAEARLGLGWTCIETGRFAEAEADLAEAVRIFSAAFGDEDRRTREARVARAVALAGMGRGSEAAATRDADLAALEEQIGPEQRACRKARAALGR